jgi:uncharacterized membrane protein affecting hemolysin expression
VTGSQTPFKLATTPPDSKRLGEKTSSGMVESPILAKLAAIKAERLAEKELVFDACVRSLERDIVASAAHGF